MGEQQTEKPSKRTVAVRLELPPADRDRLQRCARARGLSLSGYSRQAVLTAIKADEGEASRRTSDNQESIRC